MTDPIELEDAVRTAQEALGSPEAVARLRAELAARLESTAGAEASTSEPGLPLTAASGKVAKLALLAVAGLGALGAATYLGFGRIEPETLGGPVAIVRVVPPVPPAAKPVDVAVAPVAAPEPAAAPELAGPPATATPRANPRRPAIRAAVPVEAAPQPSAAEPAPSEVELVTRAQALLESKPAAARALLDEHLRRYPRGMLSEERDVLGIDAALALGERDRASELARGFIERYPRSSHVRRFQPLVRSQERRGPDTHPATLQREE